jgi:DNA repair ATPase RecN
MRKVFLRSIETNNGFLENARVTLSPGLTCIIGARGTCKTTVVESIRFAFDTDEDHITRITKPADRNGKDAGVITATLASGSVQCVVEVHNGTEVTEYTIQREMGSAPRVLRAGIREPNAEVLLQDIEIYSQGDMQLIASSDQPQKRLQLIDRPNRDKMARLDSDRAAIIEELKLLGARLRLLRGDIEKRRLQLRDMGQLRVDLAQTLEGRPELPPTLEEQHNEFLKRQRVLELLQDIRSLQAQASTMLGEIVNLEEVTAILLERLRAVDNVDSIAVAQLIDELGANIRSAATVRASVDALPINDRALALAERFTPLDESYFQQRQQERSLSESLKREESLRRRLEELEKIERELSHFEVQRQLHAEQRRQLRSRLAAVRDEIFELRVSETARINRDFGDVVLLAVKRAAYSSAYINRLSDLISGSRIRSQDEIARELATNLLPNELLDLIEDGDAQRVAKLLDRDLGQMTRAISYLRDHVDLYDLEAQWSDDSLEITMFDNGVPKQVEQLSKGQRATALLPLILRSSNCPLIVDQPEDDLDNSFIYQALVKNIQTLKSARQLIFVTHNANIPVLGDANSIVVMQMETPTKALPPKIGPLEERKEDILDLLEGGKEAFEQREHRYHDLLK